LSLNPIKIKRLKIEQFKTEINVKNIPVLMKNFTLITIILLFISVISTAQDLNQVDASGKKQGPWKKYYPSNDQLFYEGQFKDDKPYGVFKHYYEEGELKSITKYDGDIVRSTVYYPEGQLMASGKFLDQKKDSIWTYYDEDGWISLQENYKQGLRDGESISYYPDGDIAVKKVFLKDVENGPFIQFFGNGNTEAEGSYLGGNFSGKNIYYYESGKKLHEGEYVNGKRNGMWYFYNENGAIRQIIQYKNGVIVKDEPMNGEFISYYESGLPKSIYNYKNGKFDGRFVEYYDQGEKVLVVREKENSYEPDEFEEVLRGQVIKVEVYYKNGNKVGEELRYDEKGNVLEKIDHSK
jgi:antitoxin component YwqK of YwqJK toxin-antitoxin module